MNKDIILTKPVFEALIAHLIHTEESSEGLAEFYYPDSPEDREDMKEFFTQYINAIERELENVKVIKSLQEACGTDQVNHFPFVIIGSEIVLESVSGKEVRTVALIPPDSHLGVKNGVTYLSAQGRALLMRKTGSRVDISESAEPQLYRIKAVRLFA